MSRRRPEGLQLEGQRRDRLIREREHDTYKVRSKLPDPTACPECGAMYRDGRWRWGAPPVGAHETLCPACHRIRDDYPAGYLALSGDFLGKHRTEILGLARNVEDREKQEHPLKRIMRIEEEEGKLMVTTTNPGLARAIGEALYDAYRGELEYHYTDEGNVLRVRWER
ncbi:MAG: BCAM0308 family protein [Myxococcota bacterium]